MSETIRYQCCNCRWVGTDDEKDKRDDSEEYECYIVTVCPVCGTEDFYIATKRKYQNYLKRLDK